METADGRTVRAVVKEISAAKKEYQNAVSEGKWAGLLEQVTGDGEFNRSSIGFEVLMITSRTVFVVSLGAIPSGQDIKVYITVRSPITLFRSPLISNTMTVRRRAGTRRSRQPSSIRSPDLHRRTLWWRSSCNHLTIERNI